MNFSEILSPAGAEAPQAQPQPGFLDMIQNDPSARMALLAAGARLMQGRRRGQSTAGGFADALMAGAAAHQMVQSNQQANAFKNREMVLREDQNRRANAMHTEQLSQAQQETALGKSTFDSKVLQAQNLAKKAALDVAAAERTGEVEKVAQRYKLNLAKVQGQFDPDVLAQHFYAQMMKPVLDNATEAERQRYYSKMGDAAVTRANKEQAPSEHAQAKQERIAAYKTLLKKDPRYKNMSPEEIDAHAVVAATNPAGVQLFGEKQEAGKAQIDPRAQALAESYMARLKKGAKASVADFDKFVGMQSIQGGDIKPFSPEYLAAKQLIFSQAAPAAAPGGKPEGTSPGRKAMTLDEARRIAGESATGTW